jgi:hypothetical protein
MKHASWKLFRFISSCAIAAVSMVPLAAQTAALAYRNAVTPPPPGWTGPVFQLVHNYPTTNPGTCDPSICKWLGNKNVNFSVNLTGPPPKWDKAWNEYIQEILDYVKDGQDPDLKNDIGWRTSVKGANWYHVPWMAYDPTRGREFVHGMTNERTAVLSDLTEHPEHAFGTNPLMMLMADRSKPQCNHHQFETWAFGVYNAWGAWSIGQGWAQSGDPNIISAGGIPKPAGLPFPQGTVVAKLLFTSAGPDCVAYLKDSPVWQADRHVEKNGTFYCDRAVQNMRLVQLDVAVVDNRSPTRWVFGTFSYVDDAHNPRCRTGQCKTFWDRLTPVGLQWGSDPWTFPAVPKADSIPARQSVLNQNTGAPQHFGCNGRLAGPVDNKVSSCLSCHGGGFAAPPAAVGVTTPPIFGGAAFPDMCTNFSAANQQYFNDIQFPMSYTGGQYQGLLNLDTSLQLQVAFVEYAQFKQAGQPKACKNPSLK